MVDYKNAQIVPGEYNSEASFANYSSKGPMLICHYTDEVWLHITDKEVPNVAPFYMISNYGKIYNHVQKHLNRLSIRYNGYVFTPLITVLRPKKYVNIDIHRVMMKCFYPLDDYTGLEVNHKDRNTFNNSLSNLEWTTSKENENFRDFDPDNNHELFNRKFSDDQVMLICNAILNNYSYLEICFYILQIPYTGIMHKRLTDIQRGITYKHITKDIFGFGVQRLSPEGT